MEIRFASTPSYDETSSVLDIVAGIEERIEVGQTIRIELTDETFTERTIKSLERWIQPKGSQRSKRVYFDYIENGESADALVENIESHTIQTTSMPSHVERKEIEEMWARMICLTPYKELNRGSESIHDHVREGYTVPDKVIAYLRTTKPFVMSPGIYDHPFKEGVRLLGPYLYTDDKYYWDRDTWKYVVKYGLVLPESFINHVMSDEGTKFIEQQMKSTESWDETFKNLEKTNGYTCFLPENAGDRDLEEF